MGRDIARKHVSLLNNPKHYFDAIDAIISETITNLRNDQNYDEYLERDLKRGSSLIKKARRKQEKWEDMPKDAALKEILEFLKDFYEILGFL